MIAFLLFATAPFVLLAAVFYLCSDKHPWHDGPNDYFLADPAGGGKWIKEKKV